MKVPIVQGPSAISPDAPMGGDTPPQAISLESTLEGELNYKPERMSFKLVVYVFLNALGEYFYQNTHEYKVPATNISRAWSTFFRYLTFRTPVMTEEYALMVEKMCMNKEANFVTYFLRPCANALSSEGQQAP